MARAKTQTMARDKDTHNKFIAWYKEESGFTANAATALYDVQMLKTCSTLSELDDDAIANICKAVGKDTGQSVAKVAATRLKLVCFWINQAPTYQARNVSAIQGCGGGRQGRGGHSRGGRGGPDARTQGIVP
jgi:hypothetical protein